MCPIRTLPRNVPGRDPADFADDQASVTSHLYLGGAALCHGEAGRIAARNHTAYGAT